MIVRAIASLAMGLVLSGCPFALEDDFFIEEDGKSPPSAEPSRPPKDAATPEEAAPPADSSDCAKKGTCLGDECRGRECLKVP